MTKRNRQMTQENNPDAVKETISIHDNCMSGNRRCNCGLIHHKLHCDCSKLDAVGEIREKLLDDWKLNHKDDTLEECRRCDTGYIVKEAISLTAEKIKEHYNEKHKVRCKHEMC